MLDDSVERHQLEFREASPARKRSDDYRLRFEEVRASQKRLSGRDALHVRARWQEVNYAF